MPDPGQFLSYGTQGLILAIFLIGAWLIMKLVERKSSGYTPRHMNVSADVGT